MPSALAFIGGGLLEGIGKGLVLDGKAKRERALADLEHQRRLERDEKHLEGRRGLLGTEIEARTAAANVGAGRAEAAAELKAEAKVKASDTATGVATTTAQNLAKSQQELEDLRQANRLELEQEKAKTTKATDTTAAEDRIIKRHRKKDEFGNLTEEINHEAAAIELEERGFKKAAQAQRRKAKAIVDLDIRRRAEDFADAMVEEQSSFALPDSVDFKDDGGSRVRFRARMVREFIAKNSGKSAAAETVPAAVSSVSGDIVDITGSPEAQRSQLKALPLGARVRIKGIVYVKKEGGFEKVGGP